MDVVSSWFAEEESPENDSVRMKFIGMISPCFTYSCNLPLRTSSSTWSLGNCNSLFRNRDLGGICIGVSSSSYLGDYASAQVLETGDFCQRFRRFYPAGRTNVFAAGRTSAEGILDEATLECSTAEEESMDSTKETLGTPGGILEVHTAFGFHPGKEGIVSSHYWTRFDISFCFDSGCRPNFKGPSERRSMDIRYPNDQADSGSVDKVFLGGLHGHRMKGMNHVRDMILGFNTATNND
ncbi:hypothetical protein LWI28_012869 [Acer negundo]|uniref:Uncharacterized protein n=1 Tax=Acer negundo TaxID=4023 RepID=A0AAD5P584_ACENE|nr:hypothetical protein LWI28_012869 [Acer negundo]